MPRFRRNFKYRYDETPAYRKALKEKRKQEEEEAKKKFFTFLSNYSNLDSPYSELIVYKKYLPSFFNEFHFATNKIHIIQGDNGQGKSSLLKGVANSLAANNLDSLKNRLKIASNNNFISDFFNPFLEFSPFKMKKDNMFNHSISDMSNFSNAIMFYTDFTISFFREGTSFVLQDILEDYNQDSNGERKIKAINFLFSHLKLFLNFETSKILKGFNLVFIMDEPESGLSANIQTEFFKKIRRYLNKAIKSNKISLTFIIASHSMIWNGSSDKNILIHNINDFKVEHTSDIKIKKPYTKVFI